ncbi:hypothetical protein N7509_010052 [Penicillium cosmopolitanum]|uniref:Uncharacterized protein n=1 Tax=Penicillium cosmopolitanum TaxID=1131564 RepID=A0A9W9VQK5_9EURO|nr:uncharacterized protein N7509_010052 [Penicillium cosmopolitanum]KAJ5387511.1 hypothetical protein N7509_010052 [Penicillium cosmopolitanum]
MNNLRSTCRADQLSQAQPPRASRWPRPGQPGEMGGLHTPTPQSQCQSQCLGGSGDQIQASYRALDSATYERADRCTGWVRETRKESDPANLFSQLGSAAAAAAAALQLGLHGLDGLEAKRQEA